MVFSKLIRDGVHNEEITCSVGYLTRQRVNVGARYREKDGEIEIDSVELIGLPDISPALARESTFSEWSTCSK
jgi:hypothetical protein